MPPRPRRSKPCPVCRQPMSWFGNHWLCVNVKAHTLAVRRALNNAGINQHTKKKKRR